MNVSLPVKMLPLSGKVVKSGGFVVAVLIGLALFAASQSKPKANTAT